LIKNNKKSLWIVVLVESGIPVIVEAFQKEKEAKKREKYFRKNMNPDNDETGIFEITNLPFISSF